jgi:outer membrane protein OmpA-like peptidoglycan-associated protein
MINTYSQILFAQIPYNFVPNADFEQNKNIPCHLIYKPITFNQAMLEWFVPSRGTPDIWSMNIDPYCDNFALGNQTYTTFTDKKAPILGGITPHSGNTMIGLATFTPQSNYREYVQVKLKKPLEKGTKYHVSCWVARAATTIFAADNLGFAFAKTATNIHNDQVISQIKPQIYSQNIISDTNWQQFSGNFIATDSLEYLVIGNFFSRQATKAIKTVKSIDATWGYTAYSAYYFIDDIVVTNYDSLINNLQTDNQYAGMSNNNSFASSFLYDSLGNLSNFGDDSLSFAQFDMPTDTTFLTVQNNSFSEIPTYTKPVFTLNKLTEITSYLFENQTDKLTNIGQEIVEQLAIFLQNSPNASTQLYFHAYSENDKKAIKLCEKRAKVISKELENLGIAKDKISVESFGNGILKYANQKILERTDVLIIEE